MACGLFVNPASWVIGQVEAGILMVNTCEHLESSGIDGFMPSKLS